mmetsp:Transcript_33099/g.54186  ORF Transcript_33099/g.54186 Transcript_33099/m.54186 type:complete len:110 (-) Transcript_33099:112-441(-)
MALTRASFTAPVASSGFCFSQALIILMRLICDQAVKTQPLHCTLRSLGQMQVYERHSMVKETAQPQCAALEKNRTQSIQCISSFLRHILVAEKYFLPSPEFFSATSLLQ